MSAEDLKLHILDLSRSPVFEVACHEWTLVGIYITEDFDHCPCGKEIKEHCEIANRFTSNETFVGNVCISRFIDLGAAPLFAGLKRVSFVNFCPFCGKRAPEPIPVEGVPEPDRDSRPQ